MESVIAKVEAKYKKSAVVDVRSGDSVKVHQKVIEAGKSRVQIFEGLVIKVSRKNSLVSSFTVRRIASGVGVEKTFLIHSPAILKVEIVRRSKVRRNYLSYMRGLTGKSSRLSGVEFDKKAVNTIVDEQAEAEEAKLHEDAAVQHAAEEAEKAVKEEAQQAKVEKAIVARDTKTEAEKLEDQPTERAAAQNPAED